MEVLKFLRSYSARTAAFAALTERYAVKATQDAAFPELYSLKYNQTASPMGEKIVQECRGLILRKRTEEGGEYEVVARPFDKSFNFGEGHAAKVDPSSLVFYEKRDGSLIIAYHYKGAWRFGSSSRAQADTLLQAMIDSSGLRSALEASTAPTGLTLLFEVTGPANRVIVPYPQDEFRLLAVRNPSDGVYLDHGALLDFGATHRLPVSSSFSFASIQDSLSSFQGKSGVSMEGYVAVDRHGNRVKLKHPGYVALHHRKESIYAPLSIVMSGEVSEVAANFKEMSDLLDRTEIRFNALVEEAEQSYRELVSLHPDDRKSFCMKAQGTRFSKYLISTFLGRYPSVGAALRSADVRDVARLMGGLV